MRWTRTWSRWAASSVTCATWPWTWATRSTPRTARSTGSWRRYGPAWVYVLQVEHCLDERNGFFSPGEWWSKCDILIRCTLLTLLPPSFLHSGWFQQDQDWWGQPARHKDARQWLNAEPPAWAPRAARPQAPICFHHGIDLLGLHTCTYHLPSPL